MYQSRWMTSTNRKKHQRAMNKLVRRLNKMIENDEMWKGRFYAHQIYHKWGECEGDLFIGIEFCDKKTKTTWMVFDTGNSWRFFDGNKLFWRMNEFITKIVDVWSEEIKPYNDTTDYRKEKRI